MKNSKEIADTVFKKRDEYLKKQSVRRSRIKKISYIGSTACLCVIVLLAVNNIGNDNKKIPPVSDTVILETTCDDTSVEETSENIDSNRASTSDKNTSSDTTSNSSGTVTLETTENIDSNRASTSDKNTSSNVTSNSTDSVNTATENRTEQSSKNNYNKNDTDLTVSETVTERPTHEQSFVSQPDYSPAPKSEVGTTSTDYVPAESKTTVQVTDSVTPTERETTVSTTETEISTEPVLEQNTLANQFYELSYKNITYTLNSEKIDEEYIGDSVDVVTLSGTSLSTTGYVYSIANISEDVAVAVRFEGNSAYYLYFNQSYYPRDTGCTDF